jgi:hypothetical protein
LLLENRSGAGNHWQGLRLEGVTCNRDAIGARIRWSAGGAIRSRLKTSGGKIDWIEIAWPKPSAKVQLLNSPPLDRYITVRES